MTLQKTMARNSFVLPLFKRGAAILFIMISLSVIAKAQPIAQISYPAANSSVDGLVTISGTANVNGGNAFDSYILEAEIGGGISVFVQFGIGFNPVNNGVLGTWNTSNFDEGLIHLRLTVYDEGLISTTSLVAVTLDRSPPSVTNFSVSPNPSTLGTVQLQITASEVLQSNPTVVVSGSSAIFVSQNGLSYTYSYAVTSQTPQGTVPVSVSLTDPAGHVVNSLHSFVVDRVPPAAINDLTASSSAPGQTNLSWTAPADIGPQGRAASYEVRYANIPINDANFAAATSAPNPPVPASAGIQQTLLLNGLSLNATYYFAMKSQDTLGNLSALSNVATWGIFVDTIPPVTQLTLSGSPFSDQGNLFVGSATVIGFSAQDETGGSGVQSTQYGINGGALQNYFSSFTLPEGVQTLSYQSRDVAGNLEALKQSTLMVDATPPVSALSVGQPQYISSGGQIFVNSQTPLTLSAADPISNSVSSGLGILFSRLSNGFFAPYAEPLRLSGSDGLQSLDFYGQDNVQNQESFQRVSLALDNTAPVPSSIVTNGIAISSISYVGTLGLRLALSAQDPSAGGVASGLDNIQYKLDNGAPSDYPGPISFAPGAHTIEFFALDHLQNLSPSTTLQITVDVVAPLITLISPAAGQTFQAGLDPLIVQFAVEDNFDPQPNIQAVLTNQASGVVVPVSNGQSVDLNQLAAGDWTMTVTARDWVGNNAQSTSGAFTIAARDQLPPRSTLSIGAPNFGSDPVYVTDQTLFTLSAMDDAVTPGDGAGTGVANIFISVDGAPETLYQNPSVLFAVEGLHSLSYRATDLIGQSETPHIISVAADLTPPTVELTRTGPAFIQSGVLYVSPATIFAFNALDPLTNNVSSGLNQTELSLNGGVFTPAPASTSLPEGVHTMAYRADDRIGNISATDSLSVQVDGTAPQTTVSVGQPQVSANGSIFISPQTPLTFISVDPVSQQVASGVETVFAGQDGSPLSPITNPLLISGTDGPHTLFFNALDKVHNAEAPQSAIYHLDQTPPATTFSLVGGSGITIQGTLYVSASTKIQLAAQDAGAGVASILYSWDDGPQQTYDTPFNVPAGVHALTYAATDPLGNDETFHSLSVAVDANPPVTTVQVGTPRFDQDGAIYISSATVISLIAEDAESGVALIRYRLNGGAFVNYSQPFSLPAGPHYLEVQSTDVAGNIEPLQNLSIRVDAEAPVVVSDMVSQPGAPFPLVGPQTRVTLTSEDPLVNGVASGVKDIRYRFSNSGDLIIYDAPLFFTGPDGTKTMQFIADDNVENRSAVQSLTVMLDATPPASLLSLQGTQFVVGTKTFISTLTWVSLSAQDPVVNGVASGLARLEYRVDTGDYLPYASPFRLTAGSHHLDYRALDRMGNMETANFADLTVDGTAPRTTLSITGPQFNTGDMKYIAEYTTLSLSSRDVDESGRAGSGVVSLKVRVDGNDFAVYGGSFTLTEGRHAVEFFAVDHVGNAENVQSVVFSVDATPPATTLTITGPQSGQPPHIGPSTTLSLSAVDPLGHNVASGVSQTFYRVADSPTTPFQVYQPPNINLAGVTGQHTLEFYSQDNIGRKESIKSQVFVMSNSAPTVTLISPSSDHQGAAYAFTPGWIPILGTINDEDGFSYTVSVATTADKATTASVGYYDIRKATVTVDGETLAIWDAKKLSGWYTVKVSALDLTGSEAVKTANIFLGEPARVMELKKGDNMLSLIFKQVRSVSVDRAGNFYVGMWYLGGVVRKFSPDGKPIEYLGCDLGMVDVTGLALDKDGSIYVADRVKHQVVKMDAEGRLIFRLGKRSGNQWLGSGKNKGEFFDPAGLALDKDGNLYVADRRNARVQKFNSSGLPLATFEMDDFHPLPDAHDDHDSDEDNERCERGKRAHPHVFPRSVALDDSGNMYVTDDRHGRIYKMSPVGALVDVIGQQGRKPGDFRAPKGIVISPQGDIFVADEGNSRVQRLDPDLNPVSVFGGRSQSAKIHFSKPNSLALGADGKLFVTDYIEDKLQVFDAPGSQPAPTQHGYLGLSLAPSADPTFRLGDVYSFPNPAKAGASPTVHAELGIADRVHIRIYDIAGGLVHETELTDMPQIVNDGQGPQYAYEYKWDTSRVASGVYVLMIEAQKNGHERIKKMSKMAVVK